MKRIIAIGDIHGYRHVLERLLDWIGPESSDIIVGLGDYIDRGPDSRGVIDLLIRLQQHVTLVPILGNHDEMLLNILDGDKEAFQDWLIYGGTATLASYGCATVEEIPGEHIAFLKSCVSYYETENHFFVHANYDEHRPLNMLDGTMLRWCSLREYLPGPHISGKVAITGHTAQKSGEILNLGYLVCIDTYCYGGGWLTALDVQTGHVWQVSPSGAMREGWLGEVRD